MFIFHQVIAQNSPLCHYTPVGAKGVRRDPREDVWVREEVGHGAAAGTFQRLQGRWAVKDRGEPPGNMPEVANDLGRGMLWKQREQAGAATALQFKGAQGLQPFLLLLLHAPGRRENSLGSHSLHSCSTGAPTDEFLALGRFIQGWGFFCLKGRLSKWCLFYLMHARAHCSV